MAEEAIVAVSLRNNFYKDSSGVVMKVLLISILLNCLLGFMLFYLVTNPPPPKFFATTINGRITPLFPLNDPNQSDAAVLQWSAQAATAAFSYNFVNFRDALQSSSEYFTADGWTQFVKALKDSNNLDAVKAKKLIVSSVPERSPVILKKGLLDGRYTWRVQVPLLVSYQSASEFIKNSVVIRLTIQRVSTLNSPRGIGISQFVVETKVA